MLMEELREREASPRKISLGLKLKTFVPDALTSKPLESLGRRAEDELGQIPIHGRGATSTRVTYDNIVWRLQPIPTDSLSL